MRRRGYSERLERIELGLAGKRLPAAIVDLGAFEKNARALFTTAQRWQKPVRIATKSLRCADLVKRLLVLGGDRCSGLMAYTVEEGAYWVQQGVLDVLVAYPTLQQQDLELLVEVNQQADVMLRVVVDDVRQIDAVARLTTPSMRPVPLVIDVDMSWRPAAGQVHLGVWRSPLRTPQDVVMLAKAIQERSGVRFAGLMAYEAQVAGMADSQPETSWSNPLKRWIKKQSMPEVRARRRAIAGALEHAGFSIPLFNGGGTGSLAQSASEHRLTEVTAGSGFLCSHLFDHYEGLELEPAIFFALQVVRFADPSVATCLGGGFVASGQAGKDRLPIPVWPLDLHLTTLEGAGEVQTPVMGAGVAKLAMGAPILFRHAKAGELAEHFSHYILMRDGIIEATVPTYRGLGHAFL